MIHAISKKKIRIVSIISITALALVGAKLSYSTLIQHQYLAGLAQDLWERSFPLVAPRGLIVDRNGNELASNNPTVSIALIPFQVKDKEEAARLMAPYLDMSEATLYSRISKSASIIRIHPEGRRLDAETAQKIANLKISGVYLIQDNERYYPYEESMASLLGFVGIDNQGLAGVESYYNNYLEGVDGTLNYLMDAKGGLFSGVSSRVVAPIEGMTLGLTIDVKIQNIIEREMQNAWIRYNPEEIIALAMNPKNGEIYAIGNRPTYNNNHYQDYDSTIYNRSLAVFSSFEPGSTFKAVSFAAALEEKLIDMDNGYYYDKGYETIGGATIKSWKKGGHGLQTFLEVLQNSSNPGFVEIARRLGKDKLYEYLTKFGVGSKTNVDISGESKGIMFKYDNYGILEQATSAFGQGISMTAIQLATAFSACINGGYMYTPHIAREVIYGPTKEVVYTYVDTNIRQVISNDTSKLMRRALESVVSLGSGKRAYLEGYRVGGKTGTAQIAENGAYVDGKYILSYIAGAPMDDPEIVVYFAIKAPKNTIQYGGTTVGPIIRTILSEALPILKVSKRDDGIPKVLTWMDEKVYTVPNFIGLSKNNLKSSHFKFAFFGEGNYVIDQLPRVGELIEEGSTIMIMLGDQSNAN